MPADAFQMNDLIRFSALVRKGLRFRSRFEQAKLAAGARDFAWYPYDCFANLFPVQRLLRDADLSIAEVAGNLPILDIGAADGALSFLFESLGYQVDALDNSGTNMNRMQGIRALAAGLNSAVEIRDADLDGRFELEGPYGAALFLGTLYHLKNPFYTLEMLSRHARYCFLSTRVARWSPDKSVRLESIPVAYLLDADECNGDVTNYWIFSPPGLTRLANRAGWQVCSSTSTGAAESDPASAQGDERMFLLLRSDRV
jgi:SAM-dependent methyltransferase